MKTGGVLTLELFEECDFLQQFVLVSREYLAKLHQVGNDRVEQVVERGEASLGLAYGEDDATHLIDCAVGVLRLFTQVIGIDDDFLGHDSGISLEPERFRKQ